MSSLFNVQISQTTTIVKLLGKISPSLYTDWKETGKKHDSRIALTTQYSLARESSYGDKVFTLLVLISIKESNYEQRRQNMKSIYNLERLFLPRSPKFIKSGTGVDFHIRRMLDPQTADAFFAAMDPKSLFEKICDWLQETSIYKCILASKLRGFISNMIYCCRKNTIFSWIFKPEIRNLIFSFSGKTFSVFCQYRKYAF